jgi:hypothetical protein
VAFCAEGIHHAIHVPQIETARLSKKAVGDGRGVRAAWVCITSSAVHPDGGSHRCVRRWEWSAIPSRTRPYGDWLPRHF